MRYQPADPVSSDIHQETAANGVWPFAPIYSLLVMQDPSDETRLVGDLAQSWEATDPTHYVFHLRNNAKWHDGKPVTAEDVKFSFDRIVKPPAGVLSPRKGVYASVIDSVDAIDTTTVRVQLKYPTASFLNLVGSEWSAVLPKHVIETRNGSMKNDPVGSGPFKFKNWALSARIEVVRNPSYFLPDRPYLDGITTLIIPEPATEIAALRTGRVYMTAPGSRGVSADEADILRREVPGVQVGTNYSLPYFATALNVTQPPFSDVRVRKAFFLAYDQQEMVDLANAKGGVPAALLPPTSEWSLSKEELATIPGVKEVTDKDIADAKRLLAEAGYSSGMTVNFPVRVRYQVHVRGGEVIRQQMQRIGIKINLEPLDDAVFFERVNGRNFKASEVVFSQAIADPDAYLTQFTSKSPTNYMGLADKELDVLIDQQSKTLDVGARKRLVHDVQLKLLDQYVSRPFWSPIYYMAWWNYVKGYRPPTLCCETNNNFRDVWLDRG
ncbi:MAG: ABC transporter substrate-binding protein [Dehalococcoidia bacterium]|nr:ABC transporter substrate-binding protein [Dehalococcoidia bacterium]